MRTTQRLLTMAMILLGATMVVALIGVARYLLQPARAGGLANPHAADQSLPPPEVPRWDSHVAATDEAAAIAKDVQWARIKKDQGRADLAIERLERLLRSHVNATGPEIEEAHFVLGWCYMAEKRPEWARLEFEAVKALARPGSHLYQEAESALRWVERRTAGQAEQEQPAD